MRRVIGVLTLIAGASFSQNGSQLKDWAASEGTTKPKLGCSDLRALTDYGFSIATAAIVPAAGDVPEHCRISGQVLPQVRFEVSLPTAWNRRLYMFGNGGFAGESFDAPGRVAHRNRALGSGFAVAATNTGHDAAREPLGSFAADRQKLLDYAFRAVHVTATTAKRLVQSYYGAAQERAYFDGCSTGGRQGLISAQRFPQDFDGILVGAPVLNFSGTMLSAVSTAQALAGAPIPVAKTKILADRIYSSCDAKDGLKDGLIDDPRRCEFQPSRDVPVCSGQTDGPDCFTAAQIEAVEKLYAPVTSQDKPIFPGWPVGAEIAGANGRSGWDAWILRDGGPTISASFAESFFRYLAFPEQNPNYSLSSFDFAKDPQRIEEIRRILDATDPDLSRFRERGGKIVMYFGWADPALNPLMGIDYYEKMQQTMGPKTTDFFRLFMVPGMFHCAGGVGASTFDALTPLIQWVEQGKQPEHINASRVVNGAVVLNRPLCVYPQVARLKPDAKGESTSDLVCAQP